jgi:hypothetical protein
MGQELGCPWRKSSWRETAARWVISDGFKGGTRVEVAPPSSNSSKDQHVG